MTDSVVGPLNVAILGSRGFPSTYGGYETFVRQIARAWTSAGHSVTVYCRDRPSFNHGRVWWAEGVRCIWTPGVETKAASTLSFGLTSHADLSFRQVDVALVVNVANGFFLPMLRARAIPTVVNTDGLEWTRGKWGSAAKRVFYQGARLTTRWADVLVSDSANIAEMWQREFGVRPRFIPYGADVTSDAGDQKVRALGLEPGSYVLSVARLAPENNVELTLDALALLDGTPAVVVGSANGGSPIEDRLQDLNAAGRLMWLGHVHDQLLLTQLWANCGVYVHGHSVGGTNPALLQALGAGAPTLALDTPFNREVLHSERQLYPQSAPALAKRISEVLTDQPLQREFAVEGQSTVQARYQWTSVYEAYELALHDAMQARTTARRHLLGSVGTRGK